jgi:uncharacterized protein DUF5677
MLLAGSYLSLLEAIDIFTRESVNPITRGLLAATPRETVILGLYYRSLGFCRTAIELKSVVHQQSLTSAARSVIELYIDMELVHRNIIADAIEKFNVFTDYQKLKAARRIDRFFGENPGLDNNPSKATVHREFIANNTARFETDVSRLWGRRAKPEHWSGCNLIERSQKLDKDAEYLVIKDYNRRNFSVHTGLAGVINLNPAAFESMCAFALNLIGDGMLSELHILGKELRLEQAIPHYSEVLEEIDRVQVYAFCDKLLRSMGEPGRYCVHAGEPPRVAV